MVQQFTLLRVIDVSKDGRMVLLVKSDEQGEPIVSKRIASFSNARTSTKPAPGVGKNGIDEFAYGFAVTCHRTQGSQWGHVVVNGQT